MAGINRILYRIINKIKREVGIDYKKSYSQCGEDLIMQHIFNALNIQTPTYLDIGAHHPSFLNNTKLFYDNGSSGVNIEPDPSLITAFWKKRPRDINLNIGIGDKTDVLPFYVMSVPTLNTFSEEEAKTIEHGGNIKIKQVINMSILDVNDILKNYFSLPPDLISIDVEGLDLAILRNLDFSLYRPKVICVETITFSEIRQGKKITEIASLMEYNGYFSYADTNINTIFVDRQIW